MLLSLPGVASAQSSACTAINSGLLNHNTVFSAGNLSSSTARFSTSVSDQAINALRAVAGTTDPAAGTAAYDGNTYTFTAGEIINLSATVTGFSGATNIQAAIRRGASATTVAEGGTVLLFTGNGTQTISYTITGSETSIGLRTFKSGASVGGTITVAASCTPAVVAPTVTSLSPTAGPAAGGNTVVLTGTSFTGATAVNFGATAATNFTVTNAAQIVATAPAGTAGTVNVTVTNSAGTSPTAAGNQYTYVAAPSVTQVSPTSGPSGGGTSVALTGTNLTGATEVRFGGVPATSFVLNSNTQITAVAPAGSGTVNIQVTTTGGISATGAANQFTYVAAPTVASVTPNDGPLAGGTSVTIAGTGFTGATAVTFGGTAATGFTVVSATQITATTPSGAAGPVAVAVTTLGGTGTLAGGFTYVAAPSVTGLSPNQGPAAGGTTVVISGIALSGVTAVTFGATPATSFTVNSATQITATAPAGSGTVNVTVATAGGTSATAAANLYTYVAAPTVTGLSPTSGPAAGGTTVVITGTDLTGATAVTFGATPATGFTVDSATQITATAPAGSGTVNVRVTTAGGTSATAAGNQYTYIAAPTVTAVSPTSGPATGGTTVILTGTNFVGTTAVAFGATPATSFTVNSATQITATAPAGSGTVNVRVTTTGGTSATAAANQYTYVAAPTVTGLSPTSGPAAGGTTVVITGTGLTGATAVTFGATAATGFTVNSATQITATAPAGSGTVNVRVTTPGGTSATGAGNQYTYIAAPTVASLSPTSGPTTGGTSVVITGTNLTGATAVTFGGSPATSFTVNSATQITATAPAGAAGAVSVAVTTGGGTGTLASAYTYVAIPTVTGVSPNQGATAGGTFITITGTGFTGVSAVTVGGAAVTDLTVVSSTQITARTPAGTAGAAAVAVTNVAGTSSVNGTFTYVAPPTASSQSVTTPFNTAVSITLSGTNATSFTVTSAPARGTLSGTAPNLTYTPTPGTSGADSFTFTTSNVTGTSAPATVSITVGAPTILISGTPPAGQRGVTYNYSLTANGGTSPYTYAVTAGALPPGLAIASGTNQFGTISGTPTASGSFPVTFTVTDSSSPSASTQVSYTIVIAAPTLVATPGAGALPAATVGAAYSQTLTTAGGTAPYTYALTTGALPAGLTLSSAGVLAGTPTQAGSFSITVTATDSASAGSGGPYSTTTAYTLTVGAPTIAIAPATLPAATAGAAYSNTVTASGGTAPYSFAVTAGALPSGLTLSTAGVLSGTATGAGTFTFTVTATDSSTGTGAPFTGSRAYTLTVGAPTIVVAPASLPAGTAGTAYSQTVTASGGNAPYAYAVTAGALPPGLTLSTAGVLSGTSTGVGTFTFTVTATDSSTGAGAPFGGSRSYSLTMSAPTFTLTPPTLTAIVGQPYSGNFVAGGGTAPYTYSLLSGTLPTGLTLAPNGTLSGTATAGGSFNFVIVARDSSTGAGAPYGVASSYTFTVTAAALVLAPATIADGTVGAAYSATLVASGGTAPYGYAVTAGALPAGIALDASSGVLSGTPTSGGTFNFTVTATDSSVGAGAPYTVARAYTLTIAAPVIDLAPATLPNAAVGTAYSQTLTASGGTAPYAYAVTAGALPAGLTLSSAGLISGTPTAGGTFNFTVTATDSSGGTGPFSGARSYALVVDAPTITLAPATLPDAAVATGYSQLLTATGGTGPYSFAVSAGALPAGVTLATDGTLAGTPTAGGSFTFTVTATDSSAGNGPFSGSRAYTLTVGAPTVTLAPATLPDGVFGMGYAAAVTASGGTAPYSFAISSGALPGGVTLATDGTLSGTPAATGTFAFAITAADSSGGAGPYAGTRSYTITITAPALTVVAGAPTGTQVGASYSQTNSAAGGVPPYSFTLASGALPAGTTLDPALGTVSGMPTAAGAFSYTIRATDSDGVPASAVTAAVSGVIAQAAQTLAFTTAPPSPATVGGTYTPAATATSGLPAIFTIDPSATAVCALAGGTVTFTAAGTCTINADQAGDANTSAAPQVQQSFVVAQASQTIAFTSTPPSPAIVGGTYTPTATATSGLAVTFTTDPASASICALAGGTVTFTGAGTCTINADQSGDANTSAAAQVQQSFVVAQASQTIAFTSTPPPPAIVGGTYTPVATATSGLAVTFTVDPSATAVCTLAGGTVSFTAAGTCTINADQAGDANTSAAPQVQQSFVVAQASQTIAFTSTPPSPATFGDSYVPTATASSGLAVTFTIDPASAGICALSGGTVSFTGVGTCTINADQAGDANTSAAAQVQQSFVIVQAGQTVRFTSTPPSPAIVGGSYVPTAIANSGLPVDFTIDASATAVCAISGGTVTFTGVGTCTINADQAGDANTSAAPQVQQSFAVDPASQTVSFTSTPPAPALVGGSYVPTATASSGLGVTFSIDASAAGICALSGGTVTFTGAGTCTINADQAGDATTSAAPQVQQSFVVGQAAQTIAFTSAPPSPAIVGGSYVPTATASSGLPPTFSIDASANGVCAISGGTVTFTAAGTCVVNADQAGDANTSAAPRAQQSFVVGRTAQTIQFTSAPPSPAVVGGTYAPAATASSGLAVSFAIAPASNGICSIAGGTVSFDAAGTCTIVASQAGDATFNPAPDASQAVTIAAPPPPTTVTPTEDTTVNSGPGASVDIDLDALIDGDVTSVEIVTQPRNGTITITRSGAGVFTATYTPNPGFAGTDSFAFRAIGPGGASNPATVSIVVTSAAPTAPPRQVSVLAGRPIVIDLTGSAAGGPFTGGALVSVTPAGAADVRLIEGGTAASRTYSVEFTSRPGFAGPATITYTLTNASGTSAPLTLVVNVDARPDPSADPEVRGLQSAQTGAARRVAGSQIRNFGRRMEQLHGDGPSRGGIAIGIAPGVPMGNGLRNGTDFGYDDPTRLDRTDRDRRSGTALEQAAYAGGQSSAARAAAYDARNGDGGDRGAGRAPANTGTANAAPGDMTDAGSGQRRIGSVELWANGQVTVGRHDPITGQDEFSISTSGITGGADVRIAEGATVGIGAGVGRDRTDIGDNGSELDTDSWVVGLYGSFRPIDGAFFDIVAGVGGLDFDITRYVTATDSFALARRDGDLLFGAVTAGIDRRGDSLSWSLYGGLEASRAKLGSYSEVGPLGYSLVYDKRTLDSIAGLFGSRFELEAESGRTLLLPRGRFEYRYDFEQAAGQRVRFTDWLAGPSYSIDADGWSRHRIAAELGIGVRLRDRWQIGFDLLGELSGNSRSGGIRLDLSKQF